MAKRDYLVEAAKQIHMALDREVSEDYEAAFSYYKNGVDLLLNGVQVDPNKERREAVKRKTTQYLKRAEEIFISHLQDNLGKGNSHVGGYSSLRFRPIRHLSCPVEDLEMCKVVGIIDKVLIVQSLITKDTCVVKSLPKSGWESRDQPTIIPQGVPYMVKLLKYYVSEDAVYLHLEHVQGGKLFSKLSKVRKDRAKEHPECYSPSQHRIKLKNSYTSPTISSDYTSPTISSDYTSPTISSDYQQNDRGGTWTTPLLESEESPDTDSPASWHEAQQRLESCSTHSYCEETGCLQNNSRSTAPHALATQPSLSGPMRTDISPHIHPAGHSQCLHSETQDKPALPSHLCIDQAPDVTSEPFGKATGTEKIESSLDFNVVWKAADSTQNCESSAPYAVTGTDSDIAAGNPVPQTTQTSSGGTGSTVNLKNHSISLCSQRSSVPNTLQLPLHNRSQASERATLTSYGSHQGSVSGRDLENTVGVEISTHQGEQVNHHTTEESMVNSVSRDTETSQPGRVVCPSTVDKLKLIRTSSGSSQPPSVPHCHSAGTQQETQPGISLAPTGAKYHVGPPCREPGEEVEEGWELSPVNKDIPQGKGSLCDPNTPGPTGASTQCRKGDMDAFLKSKGSDGQGEDQIIEVESWCHLPKFPAKASRGRDRARQGCWGLPEAEVRLLGAQILVALESLHQQGVMCRDLNPKNILLTSIGKVCLTFFGQWSQVQSEINSKAMEQMYCAPEIGGVSKITEACDWWSLGALLFELLTGMPLWQFHPAGVHSHTQLLIPDHLSTAAASLLTELLQFDAGYRLGSGGGGVSDIKCHPFFNGVSWKALSS
ncbi:ribosomal protein S6 kinase-like 1 isoform X1 [Coregonus clupeaformis]|uniref:ribosomal protein S6 kinase-like 1 isoform X1 n=1 Tax=Coregonus clupeaformis TaxID=59861 RepID=UPI001BE11982|nr:ribosomal protein S6 kinase-like 1 isoform X1 [Coregonus clupeaformis]XP_041711094.1 ribosomal protein S6 kinase-like 1 isoform X1 [Coregonus clupeaformis]XP_045065067.1 ribosomal protein S6 kinase-like 1 isoform X1 [Coregonus clupeaformis]